MSPASVLAISWIREYFSLQVYTCYKVQMNLNTSYNMKLVVEQTSYVVFQKAVINFSLNILVNKIFHYYQRGDIHAMYCITN